MAASELLPEIQKLAENLEEWFEVKGPEHRKKLNNALAIELLKELIHRSLNNED